MKDYLRYLLTVFGLLFLAAGARAQTTPTATVSSNGGISGPSQVVAGQNYYYNVSVSVTITNTSSVARTFYVQTNYFVSGTSISTQSSPITVPANSSISQNISNGRTLTMPSGISGQQTVQSATNIKNSDQAYVADTYDSDQTVEVYGWGGDQGSQL